MLIAEALHGNPTPWTKPVARETHDQRRGLQRHRIQRRATVLPLPAGGRLRLDWLGLGCRANEVLGILLLGHMPYELPQHGSTGDRVFVLHAEEDVFPFHVIL